MHVVVLGATELVHGRLRVCLGRVGLGFTGDFVGSASEGFLDLCAGGFGGLGLHGLAKLGVGVFAECVGHFEGFVKIVFGVVVVVVVVMETLQWNKRVFICTFYTFYT